MAGLQLQHALVVLARIARLVEQLRVNVSEQEMSAHVGRRLLQQDVQLIRGVDGKLTLLEREREVVARIGRVGLNGERVLVGLKRALEVAVLLRGQSDVVVSLEASRVRLDCLLILRDGQSVLAGLVVDVSKVLSAV